MTTAVLPEIASPLRSAAHLGDVLALDRRCKSLPPPGLFAFKTQRRDPALRSEYLKAALTHIPRLLGAVDRNPYRATYGCFDREFWHFRTAAFPSQMHQEGVLPLALVYAQRIPGNRWYAQPRVRELAIAGLRFAARSSHRDGSCDDYYPYEQALGAAVFSFAAAARAYELLQLNDAEILAWFGRRAAWIIRHDESGRLTNHHALAALGLARLAKITGEGQYADASAVRVKRVLDWQSDEGWFDEYGGADPGYQTVTIDCLAKLMRIAPFSTRPTRTVSNELSGGKGPHDSLRRAVEFARLFLHPDDSFGGEYGSRGTYHFYPHGMELLATEDPRAADLADGFLRSLRSGRHAAFDDDRMYVHRLGNLIEAYIDWTPQRATAEDADAERRGAGPRWLPAAGLMTVRSQERQTVVSAVRGGVFKHFATGHPPVTDAGLILEFADGRAAVSQFHDPSRVATLAESQPGAPSADTLSCELTVSGRLHFARFETMTSWKQAALHLGMATVGRFCRGLMRRVLQRRLITCRKPAPVRLTRKFELFPRGSTAAGLRVTDKIELTARRARVARMHFGTDHQAAYVAASGVYQESVLRPWTDLARYIDELNANRHVEIVREF